MFLRSLDGNFVDPYGILDKYHSIMSPANLQLGPWLITWRKGRGRKGAIRHKPEPGPYYKDR